MSDRDVKQIWEAVVSERDHDELYAPLPDPSNEWKIIIGAGQGQPGPSRTIGRSDVGKMIEYFKSLPEKGRMDDFQVVLDELSKLNRMDYVEGPLYADKLGFDRSLSQNDFEKIHRELVIHINTGAAHNYLSNKSSE
tara:strand:+ start:39 stop:449 length:411 start_codon:yes stop_codon:yes gene_type:complete